MVMRVEISPSVLRWARNRSGRPPDYFVKNFPKFDDWLTGDARPTFRQAEMFAKGTYTPFGYLFLSEPPDEKVPLPDLRTMGDERRLRPSPALLDTVHICQSRQAWYRQYALEAGDEPLDFVGSATLDDKPTEVATLIAEKLDLGVEQRSGDWNTTFSALVRRVEDLGVMVMVNAIVGTNTRRKLDPAEFRGFALVDSLAPLVFVNGADSKSAQLFTLAHELAHVWLGESALSDVTPSEPHHAVERWCNRVAAEFLVPRAQLESLIPSDFDGSVDQLRQLARSFRVSTLVIIRRLGTIGVWSDDEMWAAYRGERQRLQQLATEGKARSKGGPSFYVVNAVRVSKLFARTVYTSTLEGRSTYKEAFRLLNVRKTETFRRFGQELGFGEQWLT